MRKLARKIPLVLLLLETSNKINRDRIQGILRYERLCGPWRLHLVEGKRYEQPVRNLRALGVKGILAGTTLTELLPPVMQTRVPVVFFDAQCPYRAPDGDRFAKYSSITCDNAAVGSFAAGTSRCRCASTAARRMRRTGTTALLATVAQKLCKDLRKSG